jgi:hypothetical protein
LARTWQKISSITYHSTPVHGAIAVIVASVQVVNGIHHHLSEEQKWHHYALANLHMECYCREWDAFLYAIAMAEMWAWSYKPELKWQSIIAPTTQSVLNERNFARKKEMSKLCC